MFETLEPSGSSETVATVFTSPRRRRLESLPIALPETYPSKAANLTVCGTPSAKLSETSSSRLHPVWIRRRRYGKIEDAWGDVEHLGGFQVEF
jgi:hypothetical protein